MQLRITFVALALATLGCGHRGPPPQTVETFDLGRYLGTWYEIASFPTYFQRDCVATQATYTPRDDGQIGVENACRDERLDGEWKRIEGVAWPAVPGDFTKLKVQFFWPLRGDYWILAVDPEYRWALVGHPDRDYLWMLSRTRRIEAPLYVRIVEHARAEGYDVSRLQRTPQPAE